MDQASSLRELMNKNKQGKPAPVAVIAASDCQEEDWMVQLLANAYYKKTGKSVMIMGLEDEEGHALKACMEGRQPIQSAEKWASAGVKCLPGSLGFIQGISGQTKQVEQMVRVIKHLEQQTDELFYYAGKGLSPAAINLAMVTPRVVLIMTPSTKSMMELANYIKIFTKKKSNSQLGVVMETGSGPLFQEQCKKLQELYWKQLKYKIEPVGYANPKGKGGAGQQVLLQFSSEPLLQIKEAVSFSEAMERLGV